MNNEALNQEIQTLKNLYSRLEQIKETIQEHETTIKTYMLDNNLNLICTPSGTASYKEVYSRNLDMKAFRASEFAFVYDKFATIERVTKRFKVA